MADTAQPASPDDGPNPYDEILARDPSHGEVSLTERARLNASEAFYRGTLTGAGGLASAEANARSQQPDYVDEFGQTIAAPRAADEGARAEAIRTDLARYEAMRSFDGPLEGLVALGGQLGGSLKDPLNYVTGVPGVTTLAERLAGGIAGRFLGAGAAGIAERTAGAAATQALIQAGVNPAIQGIELGDGLRKEFSPGEVAGAVAGGALLGGALHGAGEAVGALARRSKPAQAAVDDAARVGLERQRAAEAQNMAALAQEDPSLRPGGEERTLTSAPTNEAAKVNAGAGEAGTGIPVTEQGQALKARADERADTTKPAQDIPENMREAPEAPAMDGPAVVADPAAAAERAAANVPREDPARPANAAASPQSTVDGRQSAGEGVQSTPEGPQSTPEAGIPAAQAMAADARADGVQRSDLQFRKREPAPAGDPGRPQPPESGVAAASTPESPATEPLRSLQQQAKDLADALDVPLRQGRVQGGRTAMGQYDARQDVVRIRNTADLETVAHEVAHAVENKVGDPLANLIDSHARELAPLDYDAAEARPYEGFAEWMRHLIGDPAEAERLAPTFSTAFRELMSRESPDTLKALDRAISAQRAWKAADPVAQLGAIVRKPDEEGILNSIRKDGPAATVGLYMSKAYAALLDRQAPAARAVRDIARMMREATGERLRLEGGANPENGLRAFRASQQAAISDLKYGVTPFRQVTPEGPSLADALAAATGKPSLIGAWDKEGVAQFNQYLVAKRADVLYRRMATDPELRRPLAMSHEQVQSALVQMEAANPNLPQAADLANQFTRQLLRKQYEGGLIDADLYGRLMAEEFYTPLYRHMDERPNAGSGAGGSDGPGTVQTIKRLRGSDRDIIPPTDALMTQAILVNRTLQHNEIIKGFVGLARQANEAGATGVGRILEEIPASQMMGKRFDAGEMVQAAAKQSGMHADDIAVLNGALADVFGDDPIMATVFRAEQASKRGEPIIFWKEGGQQRAVRLQSDSEGLALYESLSSLPPAQRDLALRVVAMGSQVLRAGITRNPTFALTNFIRDQLAVGVLRPGYIPFVDAVSGAWSAVRNDEYARMYSYAGGISPGVGASGLKEMAERNIDALARKGWFVQKIGELAELRHGHILAPIKAIGEAVEIAEQSTRLSVFKQVYKQKIKQGLSQYDAMFEAAAQARDLLDFDRGGSGLGTIRSLVTFLNAHMQSMDKARRTLIEPMMRAARGDMVLESDVEKLKNAGLGWGLIGVSGGAGLAYGLKMATDEAYRDANEELRATHLILPGAAFGMPGKILTVPKPFELAMGFNLGEAVGLHLATGDPRAAHFALAGVREVMQPPDPLTGIPALKTGAELALNRSFFTGRDIVPERLQNKENPRFEFDEHTTYLAKQIGDAVNASPKKIDYAVNSMFGSWGRDVMSVSGTMNPEGPAAAADDTMFLRRFIKGADRTSETTKLFWEQAAQRNGAFAQASNHYADLVKGYQDREAADYLASLPASQRAFVMLAQGGDEGGKGAFSADDRRLHPINRAATAVQTISGLIRELTNNTQKTFEDGERIGMDPRKRRDVIDALRVLQATEQRNAMVLTQQKGYEGRPLLSAEDQFAVLKAQSPVAAEELATRYATNKILTTEAVAKAWPEAQKRLLADGTDAEIRDLSIDAKAEGWAFDGDAVRKPQKRRVTIDPNAPPPPKQRRVAPALSVPHTTDVPNPFE